MGVLATQLTALDVITDALIEIGVYQSGENVSEADAAMCLRRFNYMADEWSARKPFIYAMQFVQFMLQAGLQPHTIGPSGATFTAPERPTKLESAALRLPDSNPVTDLPLNVRTEQWWAIQQVKNLQSTIPTDVYYQPDYPNGSLFFWPVPTQSNPVLLEYWQPVSQVPLLTTLLQLPQGYAQAMMLTLAEDVWASFWAPQPMPADLGRKATNARKAIQGNNDGSPSISTIEAGMPGCDRRNNSDFQWTTGKPY